MKTLHPLKSDAAVLAHLLERLEQRGRIDADAYRALVQRLTNELDRIDDADALDTVLQTFPSAAALYENLRYAHAGLCRSPIDVSLATERNAREVLAHAMGPGGEAASAPKPQARD